MWIDVVCVAIVAVSALTGAWRGTLAGLVRLAVLGVAYAAALLVGPTVASPFGGPDVVAPPVAEAQASFVCFLVFHAVGAGLCSAVLGRLYDGAGEKATGADRLTGGLLAGVRTAALVVVLVSGLEYSNRFFAAHLPALWVDWDASRLGKWARENNAFLPEAFPRQWALQRLAQELVTGTWNQTSEATSPPMRVLAQPEAGALFEPALAQAILQGDAARVRADSRLQALLALPRIRRDLDLLSTGPLAPIDGAHWLREPASGVAPLVMPSSQPEQGSTP
jgi:uncharacterized membrane protein required for colicin V production